MLVLNKNNHDTSLTSAYFGLDKPDRGSRILLLFIISLLMSPLQGHRLSLWTTHKENYPLLLLSITYLLVHLIDYFFYY
jgi:hypothetical protein